MCVCQEYKNECVIVAKILKNYVVNARILKVCCNCKSVKDSVNISINPIKNIEVCLDRFLVFAGPFRCSGRVDPHLV